ncbi:hypothetical protein FKW31_03845 [Acetobacter sp. DmW_136]|uniref:hypothetical protein n=1 Tax=Acetobacter sp. DmW_136 TaxID=2591091 RepID=UPI001239C186|nr:hypothetical protein [Acetobacter sp. DmW_136]KAA8387781.1 hypothetical protein FKW31_03845 [Acetobacter sp. DmW_136]
MSFLVVVLVICLPAAAIISLAMALRARTMLLNAEAAAPYRKAAIDIGVSLVANEALDEKTRLIGRRIVELASQPTMQISVSTSTQPDETFDEFKTKLVGECGAAGNEIAQAISMLSIALVLQHPLHGMFLRKLGLSNSTTLIDSLLSKRHEAVQKLDEMSARKYAEHLAEGTPKFEQVTESLGRMIVA